jgi:hypothetical protein
MLGGELPGLHDGGAEAGVGSADFFDRRVGAVESDDVRGDYLLNYIDDLIVLWINDDNLTAHHKE